MTLTLFELAKRIGENDLNVTRAEAVMLPMLMNSKKGQVVEYYWKEKKVWVSLWDIELNIVEEKKENK